MEELGMGDDRVRLSDRRIGQRFGDYILEALIGRGGMGIVFRARHQASGHVVALKLMAPDLADNETFRDRFIREAEAGPALGHPNIVPVFESGQADGELFIAMELVDGTDLKELIRQEGRLDPRRALAIFRQAASALDAAHESGMVHRDVKPQNILVIPRETESGTDAVFITDFGLVRPVASEASASRTGHVFGSVAYMAPELIEGLPADGRADVYSLGCVLYECLTGKVPFERDNEVSAAWAHIHEDPPLLSDTYRDLPGGLNDVVFKALAKHPDDRFLTCGEFVAEFEQGLGRKLSHVQYAYVRPLVERIPRRKTEREVWAPNFFPELSRVRAASRERLDWRKAIALTAAVALLSSVQLGREGGLPQAVADVADAAGSVGLSVLDSALGGQNGSDDEVRTPLVTSSGPVPEGVREAFRSLPKVPGASNKNELLASGESGTQHANPVPSGRLIAFVADFDGDDDIWIMTLDGTDVTKLTDNNLPDSDPAWSPDGTRLAFVTQAAAVPSVTVVGQRADGTAVGDMYLVNADGSGLTRLTSDADLESSPTWSPDGKRIAFSKSVDDQDWITTIRVDGNQEQRLVHGRDPDWSPDGQRLVCTNPARSQVLVVHPESKVSQSLYTIGGDDVESPAWAPDGTQIAFKRSSYGSASKLIVMPFTGQLAFVGPRDGVITKMSSGPDWTSSGKLIYAYQDDLFMISDDGSGRYPLFESRGSGTVSDPAWRPNT